MFQKQIEVARNPAKRKAISCSRRAGKTSYCARKLIDVALKEPWVVCQYITRTRLDAKEIVWEDLLRILDEQKISHQKNQSELSLTFSNHSKIRLGGCPTQVDVSKYKGKKYKLVVIDECQDFRSHLKDLINISIEPALRDLNGELILIGTPNPLMRGAFYEAYHQKGELLGFEPFHWTMWDNPFLESQSGISTDDYVKDLLKKRGWTEQHPTFLREYKGIWVMDMESLIYKVSDKNIYNNLPPKEYTYFMGIDFGFDDSDAIAVLAANDYSRNIYLVEDWKESRLTMQPLAEKITEFMNKYSPASIVADTGGLGLKIVQDLNERYGFGIIAAEKQKKKGFIRMLNGDLENNYFKFKADSGFYDEASYLTKVYSENGIWDEDPKGQNHICDAVLYSWREMRKFYKLDEPKKLTELEKMEEKIYGATRTTGNSYKYNVERYS